MRITGTHERLLISLISLHSFIVGVMLMFFAEWAVRFAGWHGADPIFFIWQAGAFHFVLATGYLVEYARSRTIYLLLIAKCTAFVFLLAADADPAGKTDDAAHSAAVQDFEPHAAAVIVAVGRLGAGDHE